MKKARKNWRLLRGWLPMLAVLVLTAFGGTALGQNFNRSVADTSTPLGVQNGNAEISVYNGSMNYAVPVLNWNLRGGTSLPLTVPVRTPRWTIFHIGSQISGNGVTTNNYYPQIDYLLYRPDIGAYMVYGRRSGVIDSYVGYISQNVPVGRTITKLNFLSWNGQEVELTDEVTKGQPLSASGYSSTPSARGTVFVSRDGSNIRFVSDATIQDALIQQIATMGYDGRFLPSGLLTMPDGSTHRYDLGRVTWIRDRNGNQTSFTYDSTTQRLVTITDPIGRTINFAYNGGTQTMTYKGVGGVTRTVTIQYAGCQSVLRSDFTPNTPIFSGINVESNFNRVNICNANVISWVELPNGQRFNFRYTPYGDLARVELPTGGAYEYDYGTGSGLYTWTYEIPEGDRATPGNNVDFFVYRPVKVKRVYNTGNQLESTLTLEPGTGTVVANGSLVLETVKDAQQTVLAKTLHKFYGIPLQEMAQVGMLYNPWTSGREYETQVLDTVTSSPIEITSSSWTQTKFTWDSYSSAITGTGQASNNPVLTQKVRAISDGNLVSKQTYTYDADGNRITTSEFDFGVGAAGNLLRTTEMTYLVNDPSIPLATRNGYRSRNLLSLVTSSRVKDASGVIRAQSANTYDDGDLPVVNYGGVPTGWVSPGVGQLGNPTRTKRWLDTAGTWLELKGQFDQFGNAVKSWDALGRVTETEYSGLYKYAYPTLTRSPIPDPTGGQGSSVSLTKTSVFDMDTGLVTTTTDANGRVATFEYNDPMDRMTKVNQPDGGWAQRQYFEPGTLAPGLPGTYGVRETSAFDGTNTLVSEHYFNGLGQGIESRNYETSTDFIATRSEFDGMGRLKRVANRFRQGESLSWLTYTYDSLSRIVEITGLDGSKISTVYSGNKTTVTDQAGKKRVAEKDALNRLVKVTEDPNGLNYQTVAVFDALDNMRSITQGGQTRYYLYDSLSRQIRVRNPEQVVNSSLDVADSFTGNSQWTAAQTYDSNGNLSWRKDARGVEANYAYDGLNRILTVQFSDGTPSQWYSYDTAVNGKGRLRAAWTDALTSEPLRVDKNVHVAIDNYDVNGRPLNKHTTFWRNGSWDWGAGQYYTSRSYNVGGAVVSQTYPSGKTVNYTYDGAARLSAFAGNLGDGVSRVYTSGLTYNTRGQITHENFGTATPLYLNNRYNIRGQLYDLRIGSEEYSWGWDRVCFQWNYGGGWGESPVTNNGNLTSSRIIKQVQGNPWQEEYSFNANYAYDGLNRLTSYTENKIINGASGLNFQQTFSYDRWGNRTGTTVTSTTSPLPVQALNVSVDSATNRVYAANDPSHQLMEYDANGNLILDKFTLASTGSGSRTYDADNKIVAAAGTDGTINRYSYDPDGKRVKRNIGTSGETWLIYGIEGELVGEYKPSWVNPGTPITPEREYGYRNGQLLIQGEAADVKWMVSDVVGSPRLVIGKTGSLADTQRRDFAPFGEEIKSGTGSRTPQMGYGAIPDKTRQKFTGYYRDDETGLDYANARFYSSTLGRFVSVDRFPFSAGNPQTVNRFTYSLNNPLRFVDPTGFSPQDPKTPEEIEPIKEFMVVNGGDDEVSDVTKGILKGVATGTRDFLYGVGETVAMPWVNGYKLVTHPVDWFNSLNQNFADAAVVAIDVYDNHDQIWEALVDAWNIVPAGQKAEIISNATTQGLLQYGTGRVAAKFAPKGGNLCEGGSCFIAGTLVHTIDGLKPIEILQIGDLVLSKNVETGTLEYQPILEKFVRYTEQLLVVSVEGENKPIVTTVEHPFFVKIKDDENDASMVGGWVLAGSLQKGFQLQGKDGSWKKIVNLKRQNESCKVYNFKVSQNHDYFVGDQGELVHNADYDMWPKGVPKPKGITELPAAVKESEKLSPKMFKAYEKILDNLSWGKAGGNQHYMGRELAGRGLKTVDLPGTGKGRGALRVLYNETATQVTVHSVGLNTHKK